MIKPLNIQKWISDNRDQLRPPIGNKKIFTDNEEFIVMAVGGPNARKDYHTQAGEEIFYQLEGNVQVGLIEKGKHVVIDLKEGEMLLVPAHTPHKPMRPADTVGLVIERARAAHEIDYFSWYCEKCENLLHTSPLKLRDIEKELPIVMEAFFSDEKLHTCKNCGTEMARP
jgi:3-hydroxyanthranilate 3,4-dioxygenase